mmetsp:Transcript_84627/g.238032  ORF Transcript_84627/g.238032 Transcript_84627/m.238032 type:complete len:693 (-) Transcript_84627:113-2191(-)
MALGKKKSSLEGEPAKNSSKKDSNGVPVKKKKKVAEVMEEEDAAPPAKKQKLVKKAKPKAADSEAPTAEAEEDSDAPKGSVPVKSMEGLSKITRKCLKDKGFTSLLEVQHRAFGPARAGKDTVGRAKTGCGKTLAFCLPIVERIVAEGLSDGKTGRKPLMLALAPTRELARQIQAELMTVSVAHGLSSTCLYGGTPFGPQCDELRRGLDAVVATPGRLLDHIKRETIDLSKIAFLVLDEADEMLSMGFQEDVEEIMKAAPSKAQKLLFSATMPKWVTNLVAKHLQKDHVIVDVVGEGTENQANENITHQCISCSPVERGDTLADLCKVHAGAFGKTLVFTDTKKECDELGQNATLVSMGAGILHGDIPQNQREVVMDNFRTGKIKLLIATDVAARGLDVPNVDLVVMTHPPQDLDTYVHRSGRTARGGRKGTCVIFYSRYEEYLIRLLQNKKGIPMKRRGPPQPSEVVAQAARDAVRHVDNIHQDNVEAFTKVAEELIAERASPVFLLAAALAAMTGYTARIKSRSLLTSYEGAVAILVESEREIEATSKAWYLLRQHVPQEVSESCKAMQVVKGWHSAIFDCPQDMVQKVLKCECWKGVKFSLATELPELERHPNEGGSMEDDMRSHREAQSRKWDKIKNYKSKEAAEKNERREMHGDKGKGKGKGGGGKGKEGKGKDKGKGKRGGGRGFG